ncbi:hypothetical protein ONE63_004584 [Megalurothrips usitatus]|uniref:Uncharacterized protein n=1 Tax=Megalurothrips usitatus TaxID=439358 RepID=A0AAV7X6L5_9NEOP|nr:hypothetical protein ONE63_004584 [Megalurothrips usitatus]
MSRSEDEPDSGFSGGPCSTSRTPEAEDDNTSTAASTPTPPMTSSTASSTASSSAAGCGRARASSLSASDERSPSMYVSTGPTSPSPASPRFRIGSLVRGALQTMSLRRRRMAPLAPSPASLPLDLDAGPDYQRLHRRPRVPPPPDPDPAVWGEDCSWILQFDNVLKHPGGKHRGCRCDVHSPSPQRDPLRDPLRSLLGTLGAGLREAATRNGADGGKCWRRAATAPPSSFPPSSPSSSSSSPHSAASGAATRRRGRCLFNNSAVYFFLRGGSRGKSCRRPAGEIER